MRKIYWLIWIDFPLSDFLVECLVNVIDNILLYCQLSKLSQIDMSATAPCARRHEFIWVAAIILYPHFSHGFSLRTRVIRDE